MNDINERSSSKSIFSFQRLIFRYKLAKKFVNQGKILDIGCGGEGEIFNFINQKDYIGIDYSFRTLKKLSMKFTKANFICQKVPLLNFPDACFDNILCLEMIEHIPEKEGLILLDEMYRCLKTGGRLIISTPNAKNRGKDYPEGHVVEYETDKMKSLIENAGFKILKRTGLFLNIFKNRNKKNSFFKIRKDFYKSIEISPEETTRSGNPLNIKKYFIISCKNFLNYILRLLANFICYLGYIFPNKAEYQFYIVEKKY